jgi:alkylation response protein AidB-like acyl-CoA dehydrogenase
MDLNLTDDQNAFRDEVRTWLEANVPADIRKDASEEAFEEHRAWEQKLYDAGYAAIHWPKAYGGRDADLLTQAIFQEEYFRAKAPDRINVLGLGLAGPTLMVYGTPEQQQRWLPKILSAEEIWCQGFSEPDAGSDLAALRTTAVREGDEFIVNGQKIWTSLARFGDWIFTLVRTDKDAPKHKGISFLMIPMDSPGIDVRPIVQINNDAGFSEVFFTDVRVPAENLVGELNDGWRIAMTTLGFERATGLGAHVRFSRDLQELVALVKSMGLADDPVYRDQVTKLYVETEVYRHNMYRTLTRLAGGKPIGPEASLNKLYWSEMEARTYETGIQAMGELAELTPKADAAADTDHWHKSYWYSRASCIYAGTTEIQKNIISERVLGLPKEPSAAAAKS